MEERLPEWKIPNDADHATMSAMVEACKSGQLSEYLMLTRKSSESPHPPLTFLVHLAADSGSAPLTQHLLAQYPHNFDTWTDYLGKPDNLPYTQRQAYLHSSVLSAIRRGDGHILQAFLDVGLDTDKGLWYSWGKAADNCDWPLGLAIDHNHPDLVLQCCKAGANINRRWSFESGLAYAVSSNSSSMVRYLVELGAVIEGSLALWWAATEGRLEIGEILLELGADVNEIHFEIGYSLADKEKYPHTILGTAMHAAYRAKQTAFIKWLLDKGADPSLRDGKGACS